MREISKRKCKKCGCDDDHISPGEYWVTDELCSECAEEAEKMTMPINGGNDEYANEK